MPNRWKIAVATILLLGASVTVQAAGAQSEPKQKGARKGEPAASETNIEKRQRVEHPIRPQENPGETRGPSPPVSDVIRN
jgi:hypothetical protein